VYSLDTSGSIDQPDAADERTEVGDRGGDRGDSAGAGKGKIPRAAPTAEEEDVEELISSFGVAAGVKQSQLLFA
jgi:hypothetical protein